jgi:SET domain-containing protein
MFAGPVRKFTVEYSPKRFCGDNTPSSDQKLAQFVSLSADNVILKKKEERASIGLFAQKSFEADQFITEYNGEIQSIPKHYHTDPSKICIGDDLYIDGTLCVCSCRYINHNSNNPNCTFEKIIIPHDKLPRIVLRSIRSVETGDELTINFSESLNVR